MKYKELAQTLVDVIADYSIVHCPIANGNLVETKSLYGLIDFNKRTIYINTEQSPAEARKTVLHEISHIYANRFCFPDKEKQISTAENCLYTALFGKYKVKKKQNI